MRSERAKGAPHGHHLMEVITGPERHILKKPLSKATIGAPGMW